MHDDYTAIIARAERARAKARLDLNQYRTYWSVLAIVYILAPPMLVVGAMTAGQGYDTGAQMLIYSGNALAAVGGVLGGLAVIVGLCFATDSYRRHPRTALHRAQADYDAAMRGEDPFDRPECHRDHRYTDEYDGLVS